MQSVLKGWQGSLVAGCALVMGVSSFAPAQSEDTPSLQYRGLHGYIGSYAEATPKEFRYGAGFYASVWSLIERTCIRR